MEAIGFIVVMVAIAWLLRWVIVHDKASDAATSGPFAMREPEDAGGPGAEATQAPAPSERKRPLKPPIRPGRPPVR